MIYKFKSKAAGDVIMLGPNGDHLLRLLGREPSAKGIFEPAAMPAMLATLQAAVAADDSARASRGSEQNDKADVDNGGPDREASPTRGDAIVALRQRVWPMVEMLRRAHAAGQPIVWGV